MRTNDIMNSEVSKGLVADSINNIAKQYIALGVKSVILSLTVNTRRNSAFTSVVNKALKTKFLTHIFHFVDNLNIKKEHRCKDDLHLNCSSKDLLMNNFLRVINNFSRNSGDQ